MAAWLLSRCLAARVVHVATRFSSCIGIQWARAVNAAAGSIFLSYAVSDDGNERLRVPTHLYMSTKPCGVGMGEGIFIRARTGLERKGRIDEEILAFQVWGTSWGLPPLITTYKATELRYTVPRHGIGREQRGRAGGYRAVCSMSRLFGSNRQCLLGLWAGKAKKGLPGCLTTSHHQPVRTPGSN